MSSMQVSQPPRHWLSRNLFVLMALVSLVLTVFVWWAPQAGRQAELAAAQEQVDTLKAEVSSLEAQVTTEHDAALQVITGRDLSRQADDDLKVENMLRVATTWSNATEYIAARDTLKRAWGFTEDSTFLTVFMPGEAQGAYRTDAEGNLHFAFPGANSRLSGFESTLTSVVGEDWSYFALITTTTSSKEGGRQTSWTAVTYTVDGEGNLVDVMAWPSKQEPLRS